jgi:hypothetical protein
MQGVHGMPRDQLAAMATSMTMEREGCPTRRSNPTPNP